MLSESNLDTILNSIIILPNVVASVVLSWEGTVVRSNLENGADAEKLAYWSLGCFMSSELVAKKQPPDYAQLQMMTLATSQGGHCIVSADTHIVSTITKVSDALELLQLANSIARIVAINSDVNNLDFEPT